MWKANIARLGNCDIHAEWKISFANVMKWNENGLDRKVVLKKSFKVYRQILVRVIAKVSNWCEW